MTKKIKLVLFWCVFALVISVSLQLATIGKWSVWHDEGYSAMLTEYSPSELVQRTSLDVHPPLYYLVLKSWSHTFGRTDVAMRSLSVVFAGLSLLFSVLIFKKLNGKKLKPVLYYIPIITLSPVLLRYGQEMRMYTMAMFLLTLVSYSFITYLQSKQKRWLALYIISATMLLYTHYFVSIALIVPWIYLVVCVRKPVNIVKEYKDWCLAHIAIGVLYLPWLPTLIDQVRSVTRGFWIGPVTTSSFFSTFSSFTIFRQEWISWNLSRGYATAAIAVMVLVVLSVMATLRGAKRSRSSGKVMMDADNLKLLVLGFWLVPIVLLFIGSSLFGRHLYYDRYFASLSPFFYMTIVWYVYDVVQQSKRKGTLLYGVLVFAMCFGVYLASTNGSTYGHKSDDKFSMKHIVMDMKTADNDSLYVGSDLGVYFDLRFYLLSNKLSMPYLFIQNDLGKYGNTSLVYDRQDILTKNLEELTRDHPQSNSVWFVDHRYQDSSEVIPDNWVMTKQIVNGYAKATLYSVR